MNSLRKIITCTCILESSLLKVNTFIEMSYDYSLMGIFLPFTHLSEKGLERPQPLKAYSC